MKPKPIPVIEDCVQQGLKIGYNRAHKHNDKPDEKQILDQQHNAIMQEIFERFDIEDFKNE